MKQEREMAQLQQKISSEVEEKITKQQREYMLKEQMRKIKEELGIEKDDKTSVMQKYVMFEREAREFQSYSSNNMNITVSLTKIFDLVHSNCTG